MYIASLDPSVGRCLVRVAGSRSTYHSGNRKLLIDNYKSCFKNFLLLKIQAVAFLFIDTPFVPILNDYQL